jgi:ankyrin repeat protein
MADCHLHHHNYSNDDKPVSPLVAAILLEDVDAMKSIVKSDVLSLTEDVDGWGRTPLSVAAREGKARAITLLTSYQDKVHCGRMGQLGDTPAHDAASMGWVNCLVSLHCAGCDLSLRDTFGYSPVYLSAAAGHDDACRYLLDTKAAGKRGKETVAKDLDTPCGCSGTPLDAARRGGHTGCVVIIQSHMSVQYGRRSSNTFGTPHAKSPVQLHRVRNPARGTEPLDIQSQRAPVSTLPGLFCEKISTPVSTSTRSWV